MAALVSWEYYSSLYSTVTETDFADAEELAEKDLMRVIGPLRWAELKAMEDLDDQFYYDQLLDTICKVMNYQQTAGSRSGSGVASVSNDGYSESYVLPTQSAATEELYKNIRAWLSGTGLVRAY